MVHSSLVFLIRRFCVQPREGFPETSLIDTARYRLWAVTRESPVPG
jgi:hypothetical protein